MVLPFSFKKRFTIWLALIPVILIGVPMFTKGGMDTLIGIGVFILILFPQFGSYAYRRREDNRERLYNIIDNE
jgi:hypothetical protein